jgi:hypothetical protein
MRPTPTVTTVVLLAALGIGLAACGDRNQGAASEAGLEQASPAPEAESGAPPASAPAEAPPPPAAPAESAAEPPAAPQPTTIEFELYKAGFIVGVSGGRGTLHFQGKAYPLTIGGVSVGASAGVSKAELIGEVHNLHRVEDIEGTYSALQAGLTLGGGEKVTRLENSRKIRLDVRGKQIGIELSLDLNGMEIRLAR